MAQTIQIKRSSTTATPTSLASGELAYSTKTGVQKLYYGDGTDVLAIGGKSYTDKLDGIAAGANNYSLPIATSSALGGIKIGTGLTINATTGVVTADEVTTSAVSSAGALMTTGGTMTGDLLLGDTKSIKLGDDGDFQIVHSATGGSFIVDQGPGALKLVTNGTGIAINGGGSTGGSATTNLATFHSDATAGTGNKYYVQLNHGVNSDQKFRTTSSGVDVTGNIVVSGTVDGRDVATDGTKLDGIEASADVTDATNVASAGALMKTGGTMTGDLVLGSSGSTQAKISSAVDLPLEFAGNLNFNTTIGNIISYQLDGTDKMEVLLSSVNPSASPADTTVEEIIFSAEEASSTNSKFKFRTRNATNTDWHNLVEFDHASTGSKHYHQDAVAFSTQTGGLTTASHGDSSQWNTAYGWGNHASAGYLTSSSVGNFTFSGDEISSSGGTMTLDPAADGVTGKVVINGGLEVKGTTTTIDSTIISLQDPFIELNKGYSGSSPPTSGTYGFTINRGTGGDNIDFFYNEAVDQATPGTGFMYNDTEATTHKVLSNQNFETLVTSLDGGTF